MSRRGVSVARQRNCPGTAAAVRRGAAAAAGCGEMSRAVTGSDRPFTCEELRQLPRSDRWCSLQLRGRWCDASGQRCVDLTGCRLAGSQRCGFFQRCIEDTQYTVNDNDKGQLVTTCQTDGLRVATLVLGTALVLLLSGTLIAHYVFNKLVVPGRSPAQIVRETEMRAYLHTREEQEKLRSRRAQRRQ